MLNLIYVESDNLFISHRMHAAVENQAIRILKPNTLNPTYF